MGERRRKCEGSHLVSILLLLHITDTVAGWTTPEYYDISSSSYYIYEETLAGIVENVTHSSADYPLPESLKECGLFSVCKKRANKYTTIMGDPANMTDSDLRRSKGCFCDDSCIKFGDCCIDRATTGRVFDYIKGFDDALWGCIPITKQWGRLGVIGCRDKRWKHLCEKQDHLFTADIPVYSRSTRTVYANQFCAACHSDTEHLDFPAINLTAIMTTTSPDSPAFSPRLMETGETPKLKYTGNREWIDDQGMRYRMALNITHWQTASRPCVSSVSSCPAGTPQDISIPCYSYTQLVVFGQTFYKNPHCALCNNLNVDDLKCAILGTPRLSTLTMILDLNWDFHSCRLPNRVWDPLEKKCKGISCQQKSFVLVELDCRIEQDNHCIVPRRTRNHLEMEHFITQACILLSVTLLILHNILYYLNPKRQNLPSQILKSLSWCLVIGQGSFLFVVHPEFSLPNCACLFIAVTSHYFFLSAFLWMSVMSVDVWRTFSQVKIRGSSTKTYRKYAAFAYGLPILVVGTATLSDSTDWTPLAMRPYYTIFNEEMRICWFGNNIAHALYLYIPIMLALAVNAFLFARTVLWFQRQTGGGEDSCLAEATGRKEYQRLWLYIKLSTLMGLSWIFGLVSSFTQIEYFSYFFIALNGLQGTFIFVMFDLKQRVLQQVASRFKRRLVSSNATKKLRQNDTTTSHISRNYTSTSLKRNSQRI